MSKPLTRPGWYIEVSVINDPRGVIPIDFLGSAPGCASYSRICVSALQAPQPLTEAVRLDVM